jgi:hypothetical protein
VSLTPKMHTLLNRSIQQMRAFEGIGATMEDDVEMMHQISARIESCIGRMNNKGQQAFIHLKMESITRNVEVKGRIKQVMQELTHMFKKRNAEHCAVTRAKKMKEERDEKRNINAETVEKSDYATLISKHDKTVAEIPTQQQLSYSNDGRGLDA